MICELQISLKEPLCDMYGSAKAKGDMKILPFTCFNNDVMENYEKNDLISYTYAWNEYWFPWRKKALLNMHMLWKNEIYEWKCYDVLMRIIMR